MTAATIGFIVSMVYLVPTQNDLAMQVSVEDFVIQSKVAFVPSPIADKNGVVQTLTIRLEDGHYYWLPPARLRVALAQMDANYYRLREQGSRSIRKLCAYDLRWMRWGEHAASGEVRMRCHNVARSASRCNWCDGGGYCWHFKYGKSDATGRDSCRNCGDWFYTHQKGDTTFGDRHGCGACSGTGSIWPRGFCE